MDSPYDPNIGPKPADASTSFPLDENVSADKMKRSEKRTNIGLLIVWLLLSVLGLSFSAWGLNNYERDEDDGDDVDDPVVPSAPPSLSSPPV